MHIIIIIIIIIILFFIYIFLKLDRLRIRVFQLLMGRDTPFFFVGSTWLSLRAALGAPG
jgi:hypothetical protein